MCRGGFAKRSDMLVRMSPPLRDRIYLHGLEVQAVIGVYVHERAAPRLLRVDLELACDTRSAAASDDLIHTFDYDAIAQRLRQLAASMQPALLETLAERMGELLQREFGARFGTLRISSAWRGTPAGFSGPDVVNLAVGLDSDLDPWALRDWLHALEERLGRDRAAPRLSSHTLDADLVLFGDCILDDPALTLPRPDLLQPWVLGPLAEIAPDLRDPRSGLALAVLWDRHCASGA